MSFSLFYKKKTEQLYVFHEEHDRSGICIISLGHYPWARQKLSGEGKWKAVNPVFNAFSFDRAYYCYRDRQWPDHSGRTEYALYGTIIRFFFSRSLNEEEVSLLDRYGFGFFTLLLFIRKGSLKKLIENNAPLALLLIHHYSSLSAASIPDAHWEDIRSAALMDSAGLIRKHYRLKAGRKAAEILRKLDIRTLKNVDLILKLMNSLRDDWIMRVLSRISDISLEMLLVVLEEKNRTFINAAFLSSLKEWDGSDVSAEILLEWLRSQKVKIGVPVRNIQQLHAAYLRIKNQGKPSSDTNVSGETPSMLSSENHSQHTFYGAEDRSRRKHNPLDIPYRLETESDIMLAARHNLLGLGMKTYDKLKNFSKLTPAIKKPKPMLHAKPVSKEFYVLKEKRLRERRESYKKSTALGTIGDAAHIRDHIPFSRELVKPDFIDPLLTQASRGNKADHGTFRDIIRRELKSLVQCNKTKSVSLPELKTLISYYTLYNTGGRDVLQALRLALSKDDTLLRDNALAELLFARIPKVISSLVSDDARIIKSMRERLLNKISKLSVPANLKIALFHLAPKTNTRKKEEFSAMMNRMGAFVNKVPALDRASKRSLVSFIENTSGDLQRAGSIYEKIFLTTRDLQNLYALYKPNNNLVTCNYSYRERVILEHCRRVRLHMYPTKDYLDLEKYRWSRDCSSDSLARHHFETPQFFNIRLFRNNQEFCGNIYMLHLNHESKDYLLVDRIQTSRFGTGYTLFYEILRDAFMEMFKGVPFHEVLLPSNEISNNSSLNLIYHSIKKNLPKRCIRFKPGRGKKSHFESLRSDTFRVLCSKQSKTMM
jgi:hypothetical protein